MSCSVTSQKLIFVKENALYLEKHIEVILYIQVKANNILLDGCTTLFLEYLKLKVFLEMAQKFFS